MNLATKPAEITGSYTSDVKYQSYTCEQLGVEVNSLARREDQLAIAQEQRRKSGKVQAFWLGYGTGDGIEASELANVRGEKEAVRRSMDKKGCGGPQQSAAAAAAAPSTPAEPAAPTTGTSSNWRNWGASGAPQGQQKTLYRCPGPNGTEVVSETPAAGCIVIK
ncbi:hypothetical protein [Stenotrophomonas sp. PS02297]|uniref:hypothetical protein n=1 Tax=Stenotrophomonas sp. PS02297 TaxID=2991423 RepID=UPI00249B11E7|nr:hypothetical protein [Stenotrophomonas sp. PS02297]